MTFVGDQMDINLTVSRVDSSEIIVSWSPFNTSFMDYRKFLGYELYYRIAPNHEIGIESIFDESWEMKLVEPKMRGDMITNLQADTIYAIFVQTLMINSPGIKGGISSIIKAKTFFSVPSAVRFVQFTEKSNSILISFHLRNSKIVKCILKSKTE